MLDRVRALMVTHRHLSPATISAVHQMPPRSVNDVSSFSKVLRPRVDEGGSPGLFENLAAVEMTLVIEVIVN